MTVVRLTITEAIDSIARQYGVTIPVWKLRRVFDAMESAGTLEVQRVANYRTINGDDVPIVVAELRRIGWLPQTTTEEPAPC